MKSFKEIQQNNYFSLLESLKDRDKYYAHLKDNKKETLFEHTNMVMKYFYKIIEENKLETLIDNLIRKDATTVTPDANENLFDLIKLMFVGTIYFHDFGKINENFQREKMMNSSFPKVNNGIRSDHSILSAYLFISYYSKKIFESSFSDKEKFYLYNFAISLSHSITKHHSKLSNVFDFEINKLLLYSLDNYYNKFLEINFIDKIYFEKILNRIDDLNNFKLKYTDPSSLFILLKLCSSLLTASDYLATNEFMLGVEINDFGILDKDLKTKIVEGTAAISYNKYLFENFEHFKNLEFDKLQAFSNETLNQLRQKLSAEVITNYNLNKEKKLFYIEAPTGSGKTNLSLLLISEILKNRDDITKIFYVFPFISLITQNITHFKENLHLNTNEIIQIHSKAPFDRSTSDDFYGELKKNYIDSLFVNFPFVLLSHIKFFNALISNEKEDNYLLHRISNSIVIIDELQSYTPTEWDKISYLINEYSESLNITFILMSATLPKISKLITKGNTDNFVYLVKDKELYFNNPNFARRVTFNFDYLDKNSFSFSDQNLAAIVFKHSEEYFKTENRVHTLIEFTTKKSAKSFYEFIEKDDSFSEYELVFIDGTVLEPRRVEIINYLKSTEKSNKIIIVATQVIEAGLDIDMDLGFKDISILDSDEQFAGRINRNASKNRAFVFLFETGKSRFVYKNDLRFEEQKKIERKILNEILETKDFDKYYSMVFNNINAYSNDIFAENIHSFINYMKLLNYNEVRTKFKLIDSNTISVFVPLSINKEHFTENEIQYMIETNITNDSDVEISGENVFDFYKNLIITNKVKNDFLKFKAETKVLSSIMSKFTFNSFFNQQGNNYFKHYSEEIYGYLYLFNWEKIYSYQNGLQLDQDDDWNFI
ncbi:MAG: CRISPR-associated helicase Cas3' [Candidatus Kapaibacteriota bacterium]